MQVSEVVVIGACKKITDKFFIPVSAMHRTFSIENLLGGQSSVRSDHRIHLRARARPTVVNLRFSLRIKRDSAIDTVNVNSARS